MISPELILPETKSLDYIVEDLHYSISAQLDEVRALSAFEDVIDWTIVDVHAIEVAEGFARFVSTTDREEHEAMVHGALFARQILFIVLDDKVNIPLVEYWNEAQVDTVQQRIDEDTARYLSTRENVQKLIQDALPALDATGKYSPSVVKICAFLFMLAEADLADRYITDFFEKVEPEHFPQ